MKLLFLSVFYCALVCSTLAHEYLRAHELTSKFRRNSLAFRDNDENCSYVCPVPKPTGSDGRDSSIRLIINKEFSVVAVLNVTAQVALAVDIETNLVVLFNGNSGVTILIDLQTETGLQFGSGSSDKLWIASQISFVDYLLALGSLKNVKDFPNGTPFKIKSVSKQVVLEISIVISSLGSEIAERVKINKQVAISIVIVVSKVLITTLGGSLSIIVKKAEGIEFILTGGLSKLVTLLKGLATLSGKIVGGLEAILIADVEFKLSLLLAAASGLEVIVALFSQVANKVDLSTVLGTIIKTPEAFLEVVVSLDLGIYGGISGVTAVVYNVLLLISKKISITVFIDIVIQVAASGEAVSGEKLSEVIGALVQVIQTQVSSFQSSGSWQATLQFFNNLKEGKLIVGQCDISAIISVIIQNAGKVSLNLVVSILVKLSAFVEVGVAIATLYLRLIFFIVSGQGIIYVSKLLPSISLNIDFSSGKSIIVQILSGVQVTKILTYIVTLDIVGLITNLPIFGDVYKALVVSLEAAGQGAAQLKAGLKGSGIVSILIGWVKYGLGLGGGSAPSGGIAGQLIVGGGASFDINLAVSGSGSVSSSDSGVSSTGSSSAAPTASGSASASGSTGGGWGSGGAWTLRYKHHESGHKDRHHEQKAHKLRYNEIH